MSSQQTTIQLSDSDDDDSNNNNNNNSSSSNKKEVIINLSTPDANTSRNSRKRPRSRPKSPIPNYLCYDVDNAHPISPLPKLRNSASSFTTPSVPETSILPSSQGDDELICLKSDDLPGGMGRNSSMKDAVACLSSESFDLDNRSPKFASMAKQLENEKFVPDFDIDSWLDPDSTCFLPKRLNSNVVAESEEGLGKRSCMQDRDILADVHVEQDLEERHNFVAEEYCQETQDNGSLKFSKTYDNTHLEDNINQEQPEEGYDYEKEVGPSISGVKVNAQKKRNINSQAANKKKAREENFYKKEQEKLHKAKLKEEAAKLKGLKQLEKTMKKLEKYKFSEKDIVVEVDKRVLSGSLGGPLLKTFHQKNLSPEITQNTIAKSVVWRMKLPEGISQLSTVNTNIQYILLIYDNAEEFCNHANDGSLMHHIASVRKQFPSYTISCLTNRLMSFINKREQQKYKNHKDACDWRRPPVEEFFAKLTTQFHNVHSRQCADEAEVAEHVVGLTINLAKCHSRKKLSPLSVNANGCNALKDCVDKELILKHPWLKALVSIPKVQPRFAVAIWKQYPTMKSLLRVYMDPTKTMDEKESVLEDLPLEDPLGNGVKVLGKKCSMRVYRILMAHNGSIKTDDVEDGADFTPSQ